MFKGESFVGMVHVYNAENKQLNLFPSDIRKPIKSLFDSLLKVDTSFLHYLKYEDNDEKKQSTIIEHVERVFAYELYRQWANNIFVKRHRLVVNAEISKQLYSTPLNKRVKLRYPDMILHGGQSTNNNLLICEIKRLENIRLHKKAQIKDLNNLGVFLNSKLKVKDNIVSWKAFQYGLYILIGNEGALSDKGKFFQIMKKYNQEAKLMVPRLRRPQIICIGYNGDCKNVYYVTLNELI